MPHCELKRLNMSNQSNPLQKTHFFISSLLKINVWPASWETDGGSYSSQFQSVRLSIQIFARLPGKYPRNEVCVWYVVRKSRGVLLSSKLFWKVAQKSVTSRLKKFPICLIPLLDIIIDAFKTLNHLNVQARAARKSVCKWIKVQRQNSGTFMVNAFIDRSGEVGCKLPGMF